MNPPFSAWKMGAPYYLTLLGVGACVAVLLYGTAYWYLALPLPLAGLFTLYFFRDPPRRIAQPDEAVVSPADGTVVAVEELGETPFYDGPCTRISIFLSVFNVHVNRAPQSGAIVKIRYKEGIYKNAMKAESSRVNESNAVWMETDSGPMTVRQISGAIARRIVCVPKEGDTLAKGEKFGMIKFGSRTELYLPPGTEITVQKGDRVRSGSSVVARVG